MRTRRPRPRVTRPESVTGRLEVPTPTIVHSHLVGDVLSVVTLGPQGMTHRAGRLTEAERALVLLDDGLRQFARAKSTDANAVREVLTVVLRGEPVTDEMMTVAQDYVASIRRGPGRPERGTKPTRTEESFLLLVVTLNIKGAKHRADSLQRQLNRAKHRFAAVRE